MTTAASRPLLRIVQHDDELDDRSLALALQAQTPWAQRAAWQRYHLRVRTILRRSLGPGDSEDLVQEVFIRFFERVSTLREPSALSGFILSITTNVLRGELRKRKVRRVLRFTAPADLPEQAVPAGQPSTLLLRRFYAMLDQLETEERTVFVLRCMEGLQAEAIMTALGISRSTLRRRLDMVLDKVMHRVSADSMLNEYVHRDLASKWRRGVGQKDVCNGVYQ